MFLSSAAAQADGPARPAIPFQLKIADSIDSEAGRQIDWIVLDQFRRMMQADPLAQKAAREALVADARGGGLDPSPAYAARYAQAISNALTPALLASTSDCRARFNMALTVAKVAEIGKSPKLAPAVLTLLDASRHYAVKLMAVKAARAILPELAGSGARQKMAELVVAAAKSCPNGAMTSEAYAALSDKALFDNLLDLLSFRIALYEKGVPEDPNADAMPFLFVQGIWNRGPTDAQKQALLKDGYRLLVLAAYYADSQPPGELECEQLTYAVQKTSQSLQIIARKMPSPLLEAAARALASLARREGASLSRAVKPVCAEIKKLKGCAQIEEPMIDAVARKS